MDWEQRTLLLLGKERYELIKAVHVLIVGIGGVGAYAAEMLARAGVGNLTLADADVVSESNINRQLLALHSTVGRNKVDVMEERLRDINPDIRITTVKAFVKDDKTYELLDSDRFDYLVDCIDTLSPKVNLIKAAMDRRIPVVSVMGSGAKLDPTKIEVADIGSTHHCPLAHMLRKRLHRMGIREGFQAVFSSEPPMDGAMIISEEQNKKAMVGTISYMPAAFGCAAASAVIRMILEQEDIFNNFTR